MIAVEFRLATSSDGKEASRGLQLFHMDGGVL